MKPPKIGTLEYIYYRRVMAHSDFPVAGFSFLSFILRQKGSPMPNTRIKIPSCALAILWVACTVTPVAPQIATTTAHLLLEEASRGMALVCPQQHHLTCVLQPLESHLYTANQPAPKSNAVLRLRSQETANVELQVPEALVRTLLTEDRTTRPVELQIPEALPMVLTNEDWGQMP